MDLSAVAARFATIGENGGVIDANFKEIGQSFGAICGAALRLLKSPATELKSAVIGESSGEIDGISETIAMGTVTMAMVLGLIAGGGTIATGGGILGDKVQLS
jgi:hypothetical protein